MGDLVDGQLGRDQRAVGHDLFAAPDAGPAAEIALVEAAGLPPVSSRRLAGQRHSWRFG
ncbi:hypothetical protein OHB33_37775 (plasmid) [Streptomyces sp. NBC_01558]|uniref:hypothetical protein n=1 Tax=unclassified Streptomyces TaxID=2593676 RepID=UPI002DDB745E|nr:hypothetical protein [Streptomyces sp. NBC_01558]WSD82148.1 hypothetical protein OHB33_37775 [Streptomyces sp. NBC_01558]